MTPAEFKEKYFLATGLEIHDDVAVELLKAEGSPWFKKVMKMAEPTAWSQLEGNHNEVKL